jgi:hypothetical protein
VPPWVSVKEMSSDPDLPKVAETATLDSDPKDGASKQVAARFVLLMDRLMGLLHRHRLQASSFCAVYPVVRYLVMMSIKFITSNALTHLALRQ